MKTLCVWCALVTVFVSFIWAQPPAGYSGFPTLDEGDGRFVGITRGADSLGDAGAGTTQDFSIAVNPAGGNLISVWLYDGDISNNIPAGSIFDAAPVGHDNMRFDLYEDPDRTGATSVSVGSSVLASALNDVMWDEIINVSPLPAGALGSDGSGLYYFNLVASWVTETPMINEANRFKVASNGLVALPEGSVIGLIGYGDLPLLGVNTTYDGTFEFDAIFPNDGTIPCSLTIYHGDFDVANDDDSPKFSGKPAFPTSSSTLDEGVNPGSPPDDANPASAVTISPSVFFSVNGPLGSYSVNVPNPSGNQEWEREIIYSEDPSCPPIPDPVKPLFTFVPQILPGAHQILVEGLDTANTIFVRVGQAAVTAPDCSLDVTKTCQIVPPADTCDGYVVKMVFEYTGGDCTQTTNTQGGSFVCSGDPGTSPVSVVITKDAAKVSASPNSGIIKGDLITFMNSDGKFGSSAKWNIIGSGTQSMEIATQCSKGLDVGDQFGSLKLVSLTTTKGGTATLAPPAESCSYTPPSGPHCTDDIFSLALRYLGGDCTQTTNSQSGALVCSGDPGTAPVSIVVTKDAAKVTATPNSGIGIGDVVVFNNSDGKFASATAFDTKGSGTQSLSIHTSCSKPLNLGDRFGAWEVFAISFVNKPTVMLTPLVNYGYKVKNNNAFAVTGISLDDDVLGNIANGFDLAAGAMQTFETQQLLLVPTVNTATASGIGGALSCEGEDSATVTITPPPPTLTCSKPISSLTMKWDGSQAVRIKAWKGAVNSTLLADINNIAVGASVTVNGLAGAPNDIVWEIFQAGTSTKIGESYFHLSCSDPDMNGGEDCGKREGNAKGSTGINDWILAGMIDSDETLVCLP